MIAILFVTIFKSLLIILCLEIGGNTDIILTN